MLKGQPSYRKGVDGLKTGTTDLAGASFVAHSNEKWHEHYHSHFEC